MLAGAGSEGIRGGGLSRLRRAAALGPRRAGGLRRAIIDKLNAALNAALATEEVRARLALEGAEAQPTTPGHSRRHIDREVTMWSDLVKAAGIKPE